MQKIMLTLLFCSVIAVANNEQNSNEANSILMKTLQEVYTLDKSPRHFIPTI